MKTTVEIKIEELTENALDTAKSTVQLFEHAETLNKKKKWSFVDCGFLFFYSMDFLASFSKTVDSGKEVISAVRTTKPEVSPVVKVIANPFKFNLTPLQLFILNPPLCYLNLQSK